MTPYKGHLHSHGRDSFPLSQFQSELTIPVLCDKDCTALHVQSHQTVCSDSFPTRSTYRYLRRPSVYMELLQHVRLLHLRNGILKGLIPFSMKSQLKFPSIAKVCVQDLISLVAQCQKWWTPLDVINRVPKALMCLTESWEEQELKAVDGSAWPGMGLLLLPALLCSWSKDHRNIVE